MRRHQLLFDSERSNVAVYIAGELEVCSEGAERGSNPDGAARADRECGWACCAGSHARAQHQCDAFLGLTRQRVHFLSCLTFTGGGLT